jgi:hypothetical protein
VLADGEIGDHDVAPEEEQRPPTADIVGGEAD